MPRKPTKRQLEKELCALSWWLIERKVAYYMPEVLHDTWKPYVICEDWEYDEAEKRYLTLVRELGSTNTLVHKTWPGFEDLMLPPHDPMMEVDRERPSVQLVIHKLSHSKWTRI